MDDVCAMLNKHGYGVLYFDIKNNGDVWYEDNIEKINNIKSDIVLWPVYTDFNYDKWNQIEKYEYAAQANKLKGPVLYVNSYNLDSNEDESAKGGACLFRNGLIQKEIPSVKEDILIIGI